MQKGTVAGIGTTSSVLDTYLSNNTQRYNFLPNTQAKVYFQQLRILSESDIEQTDFGMGDDLIFEFELCFNDTLSSLDLGINIKDAYGEIVTHVCNMDSEFNVSGVQGEHVLFRIRIPEIKYTPGIYFLDTAIGDGNLLFDKHPDFAQINVHDSPFVKRAGGFPRHVKLFSTSLWDKTIHSSVHLIKG